MAGRAAGRPTMSDVARHSGVSKAAVSYVLAGRQDKQLTSATRARVLQAASELGYVPNSAAAALSRGHGNVVLLVIDPTFTGEVSARTVDNVTVGITALGHAVLVHRMLSEEQLCATVQAVQPLGVMLLTPVSAATHERMTALGARHVVGAAPATGRPRDTDRFWEVDLGVAQARLLAERGHRRIGYLMPDDGSPRLPLARARLAGAVAECGRRELPEPVTASAPLDRTAVAAVLPALREAGVTAVCGHDDRMAMAVLAAVADLGWSAPTDLAVVGADNEVESLLTTPPLSTVWLPDTDYGTRAAEWLQAALVGERVDATADLRRAIPAVELIPRGST